MRYPRRRLATSMLGLVAPLAVAACGATAPHGHNELNAGAASVPTTYQEIGSAETGSGSSGLTTSDGPPRDGQQAAGTSRQRAQIAVNYECSPGGPTCRWSSEASQTGLVPVPPSSMLHARSGRGQPSRLRARTTRASPSNQCTTLPDRTFASRSTIDALARGGGTLTLCAPGNSASKAGDGGYHDSRGVWGRITGVASPVVQAGCLAATLAVAFTLLVTFGGPSATTPSAAACSQTKTFITGTPDQSLLSILGCCVAERLPQTRFLSRSGRPSPGRFSGCSGGRSLSTTFAAHA